MTGQLNFWPNSATFFFGAGLLSADLFGLIAVFIAEPVFLIVSFFFVVLKTVSGPSTSFFHNTFSQSL